MAISKEVRRLDARWRAGTGWPQRLEWIEIDGLRGWTGQRFEMRFPIMAIVGENGVGKSTVLQCAASVYRSYPKNRKKVRFASDFFPDTAWEKIKKATIRYSVRQGSATFPATIRKPENRWHGNIERRVRPVEYVDLSRIQPVPARTGYSKIAKGQFKEVRAATFDSDRLARFSAIMGREYESARMAITNADDRRSVPVVSQYGSPYSGFHQGAGETTVAELLQVDLPQYGLILIDEIESSLHPRSQRRLIRDLAEHCRERELQVILTTHSPYVLDELPLDARAYIMQSVTGKRQIVYGISPDFAMTRMDDIPHHECDLYVEDARGATMLREIIVAHDADLVQRCQIVPCGGAQVGQALGQMAFYRRFPRPTCIFLDGDQPDTQGCVLLPGDDAPERVVFEGLKSGGWYKLAERLGRQFPVVADACGRAMLMADHHGWLQAAAAPLHVGGDFLWEAMCSEWAMNCLPPDQAKRITQPITDALLAGVPNVSVPSTGSLPLFSQ